MSESPSQVFRDWLEASGKTLVGEQYAKSRTKWHFAFEEDGWTHIGFVERQDRVKLDGIIEVDKRYRPMDGFPVDRRGREKVKAYLHCVMNGDMSEVAVMTPWSFDIGQLDDERPDRFDDKKGVMVFRVKPEAYRVHSLLGTLDGNLIEMVEEQ